MKQSDSYQKPQVLQKSDSTLLVYKPIGYTPLDVIHYLQANDKDFAKLTIGYAGRLDPMAEGLLLLLLRDENKNKVYYEQLTKEYIFECTMGLKTDTLDVLGLITHVDTYSESLNILSALQNKLGNFKGNIDLPYPVFSAKRVKGKPLYYWARKGKLSQITIPSAKVTIQSLELLAINEHSANDLAQTAISKVNLVKGNFRQQEIINSWQKFGDDYKDNIFHSVTLKATVSPGTYIRSLCERIGNELDVPAMATSIKRTAIGDYRIK